MSDPFKDHFSKHSQCYADARPGYPVELFARLSRLSPSASVGWDCGTGNGQAAVSLAAHFARVVATDPSEQQIRQAKLDPGVDYVVASAENCCLADRTVDLITVAQALHWFELDRFYREVHRVAVPHAVVAAWTYQLFRMAPGVDRHVEEFYYDTVSDYWPKERRHVDSGYTTLEFPFHSLQVPAPPMRVDWTLQQVMRYIRSWSATQRYLELNGDDPLAELEAKLALVWGSHETRTVEWPLALLVGRVQ